MDGIKAELDAAVQTARQALEQFNAQPLMESKRGGPRPSPWWRVWVQASEVAQRWHRQLAREQEAASRSFDDELNRLLGESPSSGRD